MLKSLKLKKKEYQKLILYLFSINLNCKEKLLIIFGVEERFFHWLFKTADRYDL